MIQTGGCQCGAVKFKTTGDPVRSLACHCTTCKLRSGSVYGVGVYFEQAQVQIVQGDIQKYKFLSDTTGRWICNEFCTQCGSAFSWALEMRPGVRAIAGGAFDDPDWFKLDAHIWTQSARSDMCYPDEMNVFKQAMV